MEESAVDQTFSAIRRRFSFNVARVRSIIKVYDTLHFMNKKPSARKDDVLRSAVVLLHASLEDLMRGVIRWCNPVHNDNFIKELTLESLREDGDTAKFSLKSLRHHQDTTVNELMHIAVDKYLSDKSFNNTSHLCGTLDVLDVETKVFKKYMPKLDEMMARRHKIVHHSDRIDLSATNHGRPRPISKKQVDDWASVVNDFGKLLLAEARKEPQN